MVRGGEVALMAYPPLPSPCPPPPLPPRKITRTVPGPRTLIRPKGCGDINCATKVESGGWGGGSGGGGPVITFPYKYLSLVIMPGWGPQTVNSFSIYVSL